MNPSADPPPLPTEAVIVDLLRSPEGRVRLAAALARYLWEQEQEQERLAALRRTAR